MLFDTPQLAKTIEEIYRFPLRQSRPTRSTASFAPAFLRKTGRTRHGSRDDDRLCIVHEEEQTHEPRIICSLGLAAPENSTP